MYLYTSPSLHKCWSLHHPVQNVIKNNLSEVLNLERLQHMHWENVGLIECLSLRTQFQVVIIIGAIEIIKRVIQIVTIIISRLFHICFDNFLLQLSDIFTVLTEILQFLTTHKLKLA